MPAPRPRPNVRRVRTRRAALALLLAAASAPAQSVVGTMPGRPHAQPAPRAWREHTFDRHATHLAFSGDDLWIGTSGGGVVRWDTSVDTYDKWTRVDDDLPDNTVFDLVVDGAQAWAATGEGLAYFDGAAWSLVPVGELPLAHAVSSVARAADGTLWVGTFDQGLFVGGPGAWTHLHTGNSGLSDDFVTSIGLTPGGAAWIGAWGDGLDRFDGTTWQHWGAGAPSSDAGGAGGGLLSVFAYVKAVDPTDGAVWLWCDDDDFDPQVGVQRFDGTTWTTYTTATSGIASDYVHSVAVHADGSVWFQGTGGVSRLDGGAWTTWPDVSSVFDFNISRGRSIAFADDGTVWVGTADGFARLDGGTFTPFSTGELSGLDVPSVAAAPDGTVWFAAGAGLQSRTRGTWTTFTSADSPLPHDDTRAVATAPSGAVLVGTFGGAALRDADGRWTVWTVAGGDLTVNQTTAVAHAADGTLWFAHGIYGGGASRRAPDGTWTHFVPGTSGLPASSVWSVACDDARGDTWFGTSAGLARLDAGGAWTVWSTMQGLPHTVVRDVHVADDGVVWTAGPGGAARLAGDVVEAFTAADGLAETGARSVHVAADGTVRVGHDIAGLSTYHGRRWTTASFEDGLAHPRVHDMTEDRAGNLWLGTGFGVGVHRPLGVVGP